MIGLGACGTPISEGWCGARAPPPLPLRANKARFRSQLSASWALVRTATLLFALPRADPQDAIEAARKPARDRWNLAAPAPPVSFGVPLSAWSATVLSGRYPGGFRDRPVDRQSPRKPENRSPAADSLRTCCLGRSSTLLQNLVQRPISARLALVRVRIPLAQDPYFASEHSVRSRSRVGGSRSGAVVVDQIKHDRMV